MIRVEEGAGRRSDHDGACRRRAGLCPRAGRDAAVPARDQSGWPYGCPSQYVCLYTNAAGSYPSGPHTNYKYYGYDNFSNVLGNHLIVNNQTGGAKVYPCLGYNGTNCNAYAFGWPDGVTTNYIRAGWGLVAELHPDQLDQAHSLITTRRLPQGSRALGSCIPRADLELAVGARQVHLDRLRRDEQRLGDRAVRHPGGRHRRDAQLARRQRLRPADARPARGRAPATRSSVRARSATGPAPHASARSRPRRKSPRACARLPPRRTAAPSCTSVLARSSRAGERASAASDSCIRASPRSPPSACPATRSARPSVRRRAPAAREPHLLVGDRPARVTVAEPEVRQRGLRAPGGEGGVDPPGRREPRAPLPARSTAHPVPPRPPARSSRARASRKNGMSANPRISPANRSSLAAAPDDLPCSSRAMREVRQAERQRCRDASLASGVQRRLSVGLGLRERAAVDREPAAKRHPDGE